MKPLNWFPSSIVTDRKSRFQGFHVALTSPDEIPTLLARCQQENRAVKRASHPHMIAWRCTTGSQDRQGFDDNGEKGAGSRLLEGVVLRHNLVNTMVIVTRWYGGTPLGGARFRHIVQVALNSVKHR
ncbi:hypothetical protein DICA3_C16842 [Diutina catenulata]